MFLASLGLFDGFGVRQAGDWRTVGRGFRLFGFCDTWILIHLDEVHVGRNRIGYTGEDEMRPGNEMEEM